MFVGALCYTLYISTFAYYPSRASILATSAILGVAAGVLWTAQVCCLMLGVGLPCVYAHMFVFVDQGNFITLNSTDDNRGRNGGLFWCDVM